jgi:hypothetical protein
VAILVSLYTKVDGLYLLLLVLFLRSLLNLHQSGSARDLCLTAVLVGLVASTRYTGGIYILLVPFAFPRGDPKDFLKRTGILLLVSFAAFSQSTPYALINFRLFVDTFRFQLGNFRGPGGVPLPSQPNGFLHYLTTFVPFGIGWPVWIISLLGLLAACFKGDGRERLLALGFFTGYGFMSLADVRWVYYSVTFLPFVLVFFASGLNVLERYLKPVIWKGVIAGTLIHLFLYGSSFAMLYYKKNTRELASDYISRNISPDTPIGIFRSFFWTPGILRQYRSPYPLVLGGTDSTPMYEAVKNFNSAALPRIFVSSEIETGPFFRHRNYFSKEVEAIENLFSRYRVIAEFESRPSFFGIPFWLRNPPDEMLFAAPTITIRELLYER